MEVPRKLKIELPYDPAILLLNIYPEEMKSLSQKKIYAPMFTAALSIVAKIQKQPICLSTDEWLKIWYI